MVTNDLQMTSNRMTAIYPQSSTAVWWEQPTVSTKHKEI